MFSMNRFSAILYKELHDFGKNKNILIMALMPIGFGWIYSRIFLGEGKADINETLQILNLVIGMSFIMTSLFSLGMAIAEEKEKKTMRTLLLSGVTPLEFFFGKAFPVIVSSILINVALFFMMGLDMTYFATYFAVSSLIVLVMTIFGAVLGIISPNQMTTGVYGMPMMLLFFLLPMLAIMDDSFQIFADIVPTNMLNLILQIQINNPNPDVWLIASKYLVILGWFLLSLIVFTIAYRKVGIDR